MSCAWNWFAASAGCTWTPTWSALRPLDSLLEGLRAFAAYDDPDDTVISGAVMGAVPRHPALERAVQLVDGSVGSGHVIDATGPRFLTPIFAADPELVAFPH